MMIGKFVDRTIWFCALCLVMLGLSVSGAERVRIGTMSKVDALDDTLRLMSEEGLGDFVFGHGEDWTPEKVRACLEGCHSKGFVFALPELQGRLSGVTKEVYADSLAEIVRLVETNRSCFVGTETFSEPDGELIYWPQSVIENAAVKLPPIATYSQGEAAIERELKGFVERSRAAGVPEPYFSIVASFAFPARMARAGFPRVDLEVTYTSELERCFAGAKTAAEVLGHGAFGADMAVGWYGGIQFDDLWFARWRTSLFHAFLRGANPIYLEYNASYYKLHGRNYDEKHLATKMTRAALAEVAAYARQNPRPDGLPLAAAAAVLGRNDGFVGVFQTHLYGQRTNEAFKIGAADRAWKLFDGLYRRRAWQDRDQWGESDYSGNPPLGAADILPYDAPESAWRKYKTIFFLGRNTMGDELYGKLVRFVEQGGTLLLAACHLDVADRPNAAFAPYNGGDWTRLVGVRATERTWRLPHGVKFCANPPCGWKFQPLRGSWDPDFTDGGFRVPEIELTDAKPIAVASDRFSDKNFPGGLKPVVLYKRLGKGTVVFVASIDSPGETGVNGLYRYLLEKAMEATDVWPKVECSDRVRWSVYADGTVYLLNTEANIRQEAIVRWTAESSSVQVLLDPCEMRRVAQ